jgi:hypothetical protein
LLEYWQEWPSVSELFRGFVGYKPLSKEEQERRNKAAAQDVARQLGNPVAYEQLPKWLRDAHAHNKQRQTPKPPSGG